MDDFDAVYSAAFLNGDKNNTLVAQHWSCTNEVDVTEKLCTCTNSTQRRHIDCTFITRFFQLRAGSTLFSSQFCTDHNLRGSTAVAQATSSSEHTVLCSHYASQHTMITSSTVCRE
ncbi:unnamed protein product, partial [Sphacelaria rigidula]